jgi:catechol 2,3-dioxygenase-like lactoylglutathione lyase family enzyme
MSAALDHIILPARDRATSAAFLARMLDLPEGREVGHFTCLPLGNGVTIDVMETESDRPLHLAFLVDDTTFDKALAIIHEDDVEHWADPGHNQPGTINHRFGGRGVYFADPAGNNLELLTHSMPLPA